LKICIFEDQKYDNFYPMTMTRPVFELRCGKTTLMEKIKRNLPAAETVYFLREHLAAVFKENVKDGLVNNLKALKDDVFIVNGRLLPKKGDLKLEGDEEIAVKGEDIVYARVKKATMEKMLAGSLEDTLKNLREELSTKETDLTLIEYPWDLINENSKAIEEDFRALGSGIRGDVHSTCVILGDKENLYIAKTARIYPYVVLDVENGPIIIDEGAVIHPFSRIEGPSAIGENCLILGGKIRSGSSFGPVCRVSGETEECIIHGYANKYHIGFLGHSYVGKWVNIGALTTSSDLKNNYTTVQIYFKGKIVDTKTQKLGSFIGDHCKFSIGCLLNTGSVIGVACNILTSGELTPRYIPSFCWYLRGRLSRGAGFKKTIITERTMMARRGIEMTKAYEKLLRRIYEETEEEREKLIRKSRAEALLKESIHDEMVAN